MIKVLSKPKSERKPEARPKPETPKPETKPKPEPEPEVKVKINKRKLNNLGKYFDELRHKFSKKEIKEYRKAFYVVKDTPIIPKTPP